MIERLEAVVKLVAFLVAVCGLAALLILGGGRAVENWILGDRGDASARCPKVPNASPEVQLGGYGEPDWCVYFDRDGNRVGESHPADPTSD